jgi:UDP-N-acetylmuramyl pentapeptide synthase
MDFESVYLIGEIFSSLNTSDSRFKKFNDIEELIKELDLTQIKDKSILIKGSRGIGLEKLIN